MEKSIVWHQSINMWRHFTPIFGILYWLATIRPGRGECNILVFAEGYKSGEV